MAFINLHTLPAGQSLYTVTVEWEKYPGDPEEADFEGPRNASVAHLLELAATMLHADYEPGWEIVGIVDQSTGDVVYNPRGLATVSDW